MNLNDLKEWLQHFFNLSLEQRIALLLLLLVLGLLAFRWTRGLRRQASESASQVIQLTAQLIQLNATVISVLNEIPKGQKGKPVLLDTIYSLEETIEELTGKLKKLEPSAAPKALEEIIEWEEEQEEDEESGETSPTARRYWVLAPHAAREPHQFDLAWKFDLDKNVISIGWGDLGDISSYDQATLRKEIDRVYPDVKPQGRNAYFGMLWKFYHAIKEGDIVVARRGAKQIAGVGTVTRTAYYRPAWSPARESYPTGIQYPNHLDIKWHEKPRDKPFFKAVFGQLTVCRLPEDKQYLINGEASKSKPSL